MKRKFDNLRPKTRTPDRDRAVVESAIAKIAMQPEGQIFLDWMRNQTTFRTLGPEASDGALRGLEGNRQLMQTIEGMIASGGRTKSGPGE